MVASMGAMLDFRTLLAPSSAVTARRRAVVRRFAKRWRGGCAVRRWCERDGLLGVGRAVADSPFGEHGGRDGDK